MEKSKPKHWDTHALDDQVEEEEKEDEDDLKKNIKLKFNDPLIISFEINFSKKKY